MLDKFRDSLRRIRHYGLIWEVRAVMNLFRWLWFKYVLRRRIAAWKIQGSTMFLDLRNPGISKVLAVFGIRERAHTELIKRVLREGQTVLDIGANVGYYALMEAASVSDLGKVYAFEPFQQTFELLKRSTHANNYDEILETHNVGVSDVSGKSRLYLTSSDNRHVMLNPEASWVASVIVNKNFDGYEYVDVDCITIDDFMEGKDREVDLVRMDVEGYEWKIIDGMMNTLKRAPIGMQMFIEVHPPYRESDNQFQPRWEKLSAMGFVANAVVSARSQPHTIFKELGYEPEETIIADEFHRGVFHNVSTEDLPSLVSHWPPKVVRYIILEKRSASQSA